MLEFYFWIGSEIYSLKAVSGGTNALDQKLNKDLVDLFPDVKSFSITNLKYMQYFYELYSSLQLGDSSANQVSPQLGDLFK
jgi:hypothetical protein